MRNYETIFVLNPDLDDQAREDLIERIKTNLIKSDGDKIIRIDHWGIRDMAYPIRKFNKGYYLLMEYVTDPGYIPNLEGSLSPLSNVLRFQTIRVDKGTGELNENKR